MKGYLIVNGFLKLEKFDRAYNYLCSAFKKRDVRLEKKTQLECLSTISALPFDKPDFVLFWDKDVYLAQKLEMLGIRVFNSARAIEICDNKILTALCLENKVLTPKTVIAPKTFLNIGHTDLSFVENACQTLGLPVVIKEAFGSFGAQVYLADTVESAKKIVSSLNGKDFLMQEYIKESSGRDVRINVVGGKVVSFMERYNENDFRSNVSNGGKTQKINLSQEFLDTAVTASKIIGLDFCGVDVLFSDKGAMVCEVNSNPQFESSLLCTGIDISENIADYVIKTLGSI